MLEEMGVETTVVAIIPKVIKFDKMVGTRERTRDNSNVSGG